MFPRTAELASGFTRNLLRTILVVEDEEAIRSCVTEFLRDIGFHVVEAGDVPEAKGVLLGLPVDLVFSDINMPCRESGFCLEKWIRWHYPQIKVLLTSGFPQLAKDTGDLVEPLIPKPYRYAELLRRIEHCLVPDAIQLSATPPERRATARDRRPR